MFQQADDSTIFARHPDGAITTVIAPVAKTHLRLFDAGNAAGEELVVYGVVEETDVQNLILHVVDVDGSRDRGNGVIGFWEGWVLYANLGPDSVRTEEFAPEVTAWTMDLRNGTTIASARRNTMSFFVASTAGTMTARVEDGKLIVSRSDGTAKAVDLPGSTAHIRSVDISTNEAIVNFSNENSIVVSSIWSNQPTLETLPIEGVASFPG